MPKVKYIKCSCMKCKAEYEFRLERVESGESFECPRCGQVMTFENIQPHLERIKNYNTVIQNVEERFSVQDETAVFLPPVKGGAVVGEGTVGRGYK